MGKYFFDVGTRLLLRRLNGEVETNQWGSAMGEEEDGHGER